MDLLTSAIKTRFVPDARNADERVEHVPAVVEADLLDFGDDSRVLQLLLLQLVVIRPRLLELPKTRQIRDADLCADWERLSISGHVFVLGAGGIAQPNQGADREVAAKHR